MLHRKTSLFIIQIKAHSVDETQLFDVRGGDRCALGAEMLRAHESDVSSTSQI
jgi:hypothetical protein